MFDIFMDYIKKLFKSRIFPITLIYLVLFCAVIYRLFVLQIIEGPTIAKENNAKESKGRDIESTRGNIYDCNGKLLASNALTYSIVMTDSTKIVSNAQRNDIIYRMIKIIERNGNTLDSELGIALNDNNRLEFTVEGNELLRFKKNVYSYVLKNHQLTQAQKNATAEQVYEFMRTGKGYEKTSKMFEISKSYSVKDTLKIMAVRYALFCNYPKYNQITVASGIKEKTIAAIEENSSDLPGVEVKQQTHRVYEDSVYFSNIIGYTGLISTDQLKEYNKKSKIYDSTDIIGKTGLEAKYEEYLRGKKGRETVSTNSSGKVISVIDHKDPKAGNNIYLTIDRDLQISTYHLLEKELSKILLENIVPTMSYGSKGKSATNIKIPIYEVYNALLDNNVIDISHFETNDKTTTTREKQVYAKYKADVKDIFSRLKSYLTIDNATPNDKAGDMEDYLDYFYTALSTDGILLTDKIPSDDATLADYKNDKISLSKFLQYALANNWIDLTRLGVGNEYYSTEEIYQKLIAYTKDILKNDLKFKKMVYRDLIFSYKLSGNEICLLLFDQHVLKYNKTEVANLESGNLSAYSFMINEIKKLEITPAMLALAPCSGSVVITDVNTGNVLALVSYPGYDNNKIADSKYFSKINTDNSTPMRNKPTSEKTAPGSTFKMVTSFAALEEGVTNPTETVYDLGKFTKISPSPKCDIYPGSHGAVNLMKALAVSCNYYYFEMGWRLSISGSGKYISDLGLKRLKKYASMFGLNETSGLELSEAEPQISDTDAVRSAIGQGSNVYTPVQLSRYVTTIANRGTCYDLTLLDRISSSSGKVIKANKAAVDHKLKSIKESSWNAVFQGMYDVVHSASGTVASIFSGFKIKVAGKTGTSQISKSIPNNALFVSFAPYDKPKISVTVVIPKGYTSHNAAELGRNIYSLYFKVKSEKDLLKDNSSKSKSTRGTLD